MDKLRELHDRAAADAQAEHARQAKYYDADRRSPEFYLGDRVWKENKVLSSAVEGISAKLATMYARPYTIVNILGENTYEIQGEDGRTIRPVHAQQLKRYVAAAEPKDYFDRSNQGVARALPSRDSPVERSAPTGDIVIQESVQPRSMVKRRGPPRKTALLVRPGKRVSDGRIKRGVGPTEPKQGPGRSKDSKKKSVPVNPGQISPRRNRASKQRQLCRSECVVRTNLCSSHVPVSCSPFHGID